MDFEHSERARIVIEQVERFVRERADSVAWLRGLGAVDWDLAYEHPQLGTLRAGHTPGPA